MARKKIKKKFKALVKIYKDNTISISPIEPTEDWERINKDIKEDKDRRVPRAEEFLRQLNMHVPGTIVPRNLMDMATDEGIYRGPLTQAAENLGLLHVLEFLTDKYGP